MRNSFQRVIAPRSLSLPKGRLITIFMLAAFFALSACDDSSSAGGDETETSALSSAEGQEDVSSSSEKSSSSSSVKDTEPAEESSSSTKEIKNSSDSKSSSSVKSDDSSSSTETPKSYAEANIMPSGTYDCSKYNCFSTEYLNQEFLEAGKYGEILDERDNQVYKTIQIGDQIWMAQNLNYSVYKSTCYGNESENCAKSGRLYTWAAAIDSVALYDDGNGVDCGYDKTCTLPEKVQGICPVGWHLPNNDEWRTLFNEVGGESSAGYVLKAQHGWANNGNGVDSFGFSALPAGYRSLYGYGENFMYQSQGLVVLYWSTYESSSISASRSAINESKYVGVDQSRKKLESLSVRCVKDSE